MDAADAADGGHLQHPHVGVAVAMDADADADGDVDIPGAGLFPLGALGTVPQSSSPAGALPHLSAARHHGGTGVRGVHIVPGARRWVPEYLRRALHWHQMDLEYVFFQMFCLLFNPSRVYRFSSWHKQTKNQWARDDPGFVVVLGLFMLAAGFSWGVAFRRGVVGTLTFCFWVILVDFLAAGGVAATLCWIITNRWLRLRNALHSVEQHVEWLYCFDVHCNSFFPVFVILYVLQFFLVPVLALDNFVCTLLANVLYLLAVVYYFFVTFLGYNALPFLQNTSVFMYPIVAGIMAILVCSLLNVNLTRVMVYLYLG